MNEAETRAEYIDPALKAAGWGVVAGSRVRREYPITLGRIEGHGRRGKSLTADYVLEYRNHKLAVIQAKAWDCPLTEGVAQAKDYAGKLAIRFAYATNGQGVYGIDMQEGAEGEQPYYPTPEELWQMIFATDNNWRDRFAAVPFEDRGGFFQGRYYQDIAIERVLDAIADGRDRMLLTLATGTGKTFIAFQLAWKLFHSRWNLTDWNSDRQPSRRPRILLLADRNILANQAYNAFSAFPEDALVRVEIFIGQINQREKTLVFCASQEHALAVRDYINQIKTIKDPNYCHRVTANDGALGEQHLRDFQDNEKTIPTILTTSQKLSTGVDARNIRNIVLLRPINFIIEFKQIIGRGTRLFDGKAYFTIYDFVRAHQHFSDPEWDGEPEDNTIENGEGGVDEPIAPGEAGQGQPDEGAGTRPRPPRIKVKLADGKWRTIQHMMVTSFWHPDGTPMSAQQFMELLFGKLPEFFKNEAELRLLWSLPETRARLLEGLAEKGFGKEQMAEMQKVIDAEQSDLFDVLAHVAYALPPLTRQERAAQARIGISAHFTSPQQIFIDFVLSHYVSVGVEELAKEKLTPLLRLKYNNSIPDAVGNLGEPDQIRQVFAGFQRFLYQAAV